MTPLAGGRTVRAQSARTRMTDSNQPTDPSRPTGFRPSPFAINLLVAVMCLVWGSTWLVIKDGLRDLPVLTSAGLRFAVAFVVMASVAPWLRRVEGGASPPAWLSIALGVSNFAVSYGIVYYSETVLPSGLVSVLWAVFPLIMAVSGHCFLAGEQLRPRHWAGFVLGFGGTVVLFLTDLRAAGGDAIPVALLLLLSPLAAALGTTLVKRYGADVSSVLLNRNSMLVGAVLLLAGALLFERDAPVRFTRSAVLSILYLAVCGTCLTFSLYFWLMRFARANRLSLIAFVTPCIALALGAAFGGEPLQGHTVAGTALIVCAVALALGGRSR